MIFPLLIPFFMSEIASLISVKVQTCVICFETSRIPSSTNFRYLGISIDGSVEPPSDPISFFPKCKGKVFIEIFSSYFGTPTRTTLPSH